MNTDVYDVEKDISDVEEPTTGGWYASANGNLSLIFLLRPEIPGWFPKRGYIAQAGPVVPLVHEAVD